MSGRYLSLLVGSSGPLAPRSSSFEISSVGRNIFNSQRSYSSAPKQGLKKKTKKRKLTQMPGYKQRQRLEKARQLLESAGSPPVNIMALRPPTTPQPTGKYSALFPGEEDIPKETEIMIAELDREYERIKKKAAIILQNPDFVIYDSLVQYRIKQAEMEWLTSKEPVSVESNAKLNEKIKEIIFETDHEFNQYFEALPKMTKLERKRARQTFLDEMEGQIHFFPADVWKKQLLLPEYDQEKFPLSKKEKKELFPPPTTALLAKDKTKLYQNYKQLAQHVPDKQLTGTAASTERILAHFELKNYLEKVADMEQKDLEDELDRLRFERDMLEHADEDNPLDDY